MLSNVNLHRYTESWGSAHIERLNDEMKVGDKTAVTKEALSHVPFCSKLGYMFNFGEPIPEDNIHLVRVGTFTALLFVRQNTE